MTRYRGTSFPLAALVGACLLCVPAQGDNYVVDGLNGNDANSGISPTGGPTDMAGLDFSYAVETFEGLSLLQEPPGAGDYVFVNAYGWDPPELPGPYHYQEQILATAGTTWVAVGEVVIGGLNHGISANDATVDGFTVIECDEGVTVSNNSQVRNLTVRNCGVGIRIYQSTASVRRCIVMGCNAGISTHAPSTTVLTIEQCTVVMNYSGIALTGGQHKIVRNNIIAYNHTGFSVGAVPALCLADFNNVCQNTIDYSHLDLRGDNDLAIDPNDPTNPQFVDMDRGIVHLVPGSSLINAGEQFGGGPAVTIGAHEVGFASSDAINAWVGWIDENSASVASSGLVAIDSSTGHIVLQSGVSRASVRSPVYDIGPLKSVRYAALDDLTPVEGLRPVIDQVDATVQREVRYRASTTSFLAIDPSPAFLTAFGGQELDEELTRRFVQVEITLTRNGE